VSSFPLRVKRGRMVAPTRHLPKVYSNVPSEKGRNSSRESLTILRGKKNWFLFAEKKGKNTMRGRGKKNQSTSVPFGGRTSEKTKREGGFCRKGRKNFQKKKSFSRGELPTKEHLGDGRSLVNRSKKVKIRGYRSPILENLLGGGGGVGGGKKKKKGWGGGGGGKGGVTRGGFVKKKSRERTSAEQRTVPPDRQKDCHFREKKSTARIRRLVTSEKKGGPLEGKEPSEPTLSRDPP